MRYIAVLITAVFIPALAQAQQNRLIPVTDYAYEYIVRLQRRGHLLELNPTAVPYRQGEVWEALGKVDTLRLGASESHWVKLLRRTLQVKSTATDEARVGYKFEAATHMINSDRIDVVRPVGDAINFYWYGTWAAAYVDAGPAIAEMALYHNRFYENDPDGLDTALRLWARSEHSYAGVHTRYVSAYLGRYDVHWGVPGEAATILSDNARSRDQLSLRLGGRRLSVTGILGELDSATDGRYYTGRASDDSVRVGSTRRFLAAHRWDWRPRRNLLISFQESALYSGVASGVSLKYLNPVHPFTFVVDNVPKNDENNGMLAGLVWMQLRRLTLHGQFMVDDIRLQANTGPETITFVLVGSATLALPSADVGFSLEAVTSRAYNAPQVEGQYIYLNRGLATQFSDYVHASAAAEFYLDAYAPGLRLGPRLDVLYQGERDMRQPFPAKDETPDNLLDGKVTRTVRGSVHAAYQPMAWWWIALDAGINRADDTRLVGKLSAGFRLTLDGTLRLWE